MSIIAMGSGGGLNNTKLRLADAAVDDVLKGRKFYSGDKTLKTGTLELTGTASSDDVLSGVTFYNTNAKSKQIGTLELTGNAYADDVLMGRTFYNTDAKTKVTGTLALTGTAYASDVLYGETFYNTNAKTKVTGTMPNRGAVYTTINPGSSYTVPAGYHNGEGRVKAATWTKDKYLYLVIQYQGGYGNPLPEYAATVVAQGIPEPEFLAHYSGAGNVHAVTNVCNANMLNIGAYAGNGTAQITPLTYLRDIFHNTDHDPGVVYTLGPGVYCYRMR